MPQTIWNVKVYEENHTDYQQYWFKTKEDVIQSIKTTWSQIPNSIHWNRTDPDTILITGKNDPSKVLLIAEEIKNFEILTKPTHF